LISERVSGHRFGPARELGLSPADQTIEDGGPVASVGDDGSAVVAWVRPSDKVAFGSGTGSFEVFSRAPGADFASQSLTTTFREPTFPALAVGRAGAIALAWTERAPAANVNGQPGPAAVRATRGIRGAPLPAATQLSAGNDDATWPTVALTDNGEAIVAWVTGGFGSGPIKATVGSATP
jgi:hypothetical protein